MPRSSGVGPSDGSEAPARTVEPELSPEVAARARGLRTGFTTGACAAAAAKAAAIGLTTGEVPASVEITLPGGKLVRFAVENPGPLISHDVARAVVVKDAGDDPDCTHGARLTVSVRRSEEPEGQSLVTGGTGVGVVTKPGLGLPVGEAAINPVPRRMILAALAEVTAEPLVAEISVPGGEEMAARTSNERLGIIGGISILGTTGIVRPFSTAAYRASVVQQVDVAAAQGIRAMVLCTGSRSEAAARRIYPSYDPVAFVEVGDFTGIALRRCAARHMEEAAVVAMVGKITKLAAGVMMTHFHRSKVDVALLESVAIETGSPAEVISAASQTDTARHFYEACISAGSLAPLRRLCELARRNCEEHGGNALSCPVSMVDFAGEEVMASA